MNPLTVRPTQLEPRLSSHAQQILRIRTEAMEIRKQVQKIGLDHIRQLQIDAAISVARGVTEVNNVNRLMEATGNSSAHTEAYFENLNVIFMQRAQIWFEDNSDAVLDLLRSMT